MFNITSFDKEGFDSRGWRDLSECNLHVVFLIICQQNNNKKRIQYFSFKTKLILTEKCVGWRQGLWFRDLSIMFSLWLGGFPPGTPVSPINTKKQTPGVAADKEVLHGDYLKKCKHSDWLVIQSSVVWQHCVCEKCNQLFNIWHIIFCGYGFWIAHIL